MTRLSSRRSRRVGIASLLLLDHLGLPGHAQAAVVFCPLCRVVATTTTSRSSTHGRVTATSTIGIVSTSVMASASTSISISSGAIKCLSRERAIARTLDESNLLHDHLLGPVDTFRGASDYEVLLRSIWW